MQLTNLKFRKPHQKLRKNFRRKSVFVSIRDSTASVNIPKSKTAEFGGSTGQNSFKNVKFFIGIAQRQSKGLGTQPGYFLHA